MSLYEYKEVNFAEYCRNCKYADIEDTKNPCNNCLDIPARQFSHVPEYYKADPRRIEENTPMPINEI